MRDRRAQGLTWLHRPGGVTWSPGGGIVDHDVTLGGGGPQGLSGWGTANTPPLTAALGQQGQLNTWDT